MSDAAQIAAMTGDELRALRLRTGLKRSYFCRQVGINPNLLSEFERGAHPISTAIAARARILDGQGTTSRKIGVASFGTRFVVVQFSLIEDAGLWRTDVLPIEHESRASAVLAARDYASLHGHEFLPVGLQAAGP